MKPWQRWLAVVVGLGALFFWGYVRHMPWPLALVIGIAVGAFLFTVLRTVERLRGLIGEEARVEPSPWHQQHRQDEQQVRPAGEDSADQ